MAMDVGARIKYFRLKKGLSQEKLAWSAEVNPAFLGELERGRKSPTIKTLEKITDALGISIAELFTGPAELSKKDKALLDAINAQLRILSSDNLEKISLIIQTALSIKR